MDTIKDTNVPRDFLTPQEDVLMGGTSDKLIVGEDRYVPIGRLSGSLTFEATDIRRKQSGYYVSHLIGIGLVGQAIVISLEPLDPENSMTVKDPRALGLWDVAKKEIVSPERGPKLTKLLYERFKEGGIDVYQRELKTTIEGQTQGSIEGK